VPLYHKIFVCKCEFSIFGFCMSFCWIFTHKSGVVGINISSRVALKSVRFEILTVLQIMTHVCWGVTPCKLVNSYWCLLSSLCLFLQGSVVQEELAATFQNLFPSSSGSSSARLFLHCLIPLDPTWPWIQRRYYPSKRLSLFTKRHYMSCVEILRTCSLVKFLVFHDYVNDIFLQWASLVTKYQFTGALDVL